MKYIYIKFLDPRAINNNNFESVEDFEKYKAETIEAVGYLVKEDDDNLFIAMQAHGKAFRKVLFIPKKTIVERKDKIDGVKEVVYRDVQLLSGKVEVTVSKLESMGLPPEGYTVGFVVRDDKDTVLAMERSEDGKFRTQVILPKLN